MDRHTGVAICALAALALAGTAQAKTKMDLSCFYESGQSGGKKISDYTIWNTSGETIPKGTVITYIVAGKTYTTTAPNDIEPQDTFSSGGTEPSGSCQASWTK